MATYLVVHRDQFGVPINQHYPNDVQLSLVNSDESEVGYELALGNPLLKRDEVSPYRTDWELYRDNKLLESGIHTNRNLDLYRDTLLVQGKSWIHYLKRRIYPFDPIAYVNGHDWVNWPKQWPGDGSPYTDCADVLRNFFDALATEDPSYTLPIIVGIPAVSGVQVRYKIYPADSTTIFDHITALAEMDDGFEFDIKPVNIEFKMYPNGRLAPLPIYRFQPTANENSQISEVDWTDEGPAATWTLGLGTGGVGGLKMGSVSTFEDNRRDFRRLDRVQDFGQGFADQFALAKKVAAQGYLDRFQMKKLNLTIINPDLLSPSFFGSDRPRSLIGNRVHFKYDWGYHLVDADFKVNTINIRSDNGGNEEAEFELEMINA